MDDEALRTRFAYAPEVAVSAVPDGPTSVRMSYPSSVGGLGRTPQTTTLTFRNVLDFRFREFELGLDLNDPPDTRFALISLPDSGLLRAFRTAGRIRRLAGTIREEDLKHFRIAFDEHGTYDVVCTGVEPSVT
ncbi:MAG TPA: hypothetical protein VFE14_20010 [Micromonosporaceae bacterium]|jgi:hypothetical protein|nr:hypothetical protein [Micromonosporaceae bacterium]